MSKKVVALLKKHGPMLSGNLAKLFEKEYGVSNTAARQALSRAQSPVNKNCTLSFDKNQKFFYLEDQFMSSRYITAFLGAIRESSHVNWVYISAFISQNGYVAKDILPALVASPISNLKGHKLHQRIISDLQKCQIIEDYNDTHWKLCDWIPYHTPNLARAIGLETAKKQVVRDFARWAQNVNFIGYGSAKTLTDTAEFAHFQWALTAPSYVQPIFNSISQKPGFLVADVVYGHTATPDDVGFFLEKLAIVRSFKNVSNVLPVLLVENVNKEGLKLLKDNKVVIALIDNIFDKNYTRLLGELVSVFANAGAIIAKNPSQIEKLFSELAKVEGRYNDLIGDMFELITAYYFQHLGCRYLDIRRKIQIPDSTATNEIDVLVEKDGCINIIECKATRSAIGLDFVDTWLSKNIKQIRKWLLNKYPGKEIKFHLWSLGGFTSDAITALSAASNNTRKYTIEYLDRNQILSLARKHHVQPVADLLESPQLQPPLKKVLQQSNDKK